MTPPPVLPPAPPPATARRVLDEAARLFAVRGYAATTTRDIADAVGIRQPSLYKHFPSKEAILAALFELASRQPVRVADQLAERDEPAAVRLYRWLHELCEHILAMPYVVTTLLRTTELTGPRFAEQHAVILRGRERCATLIASAVHERAFRPVPPQLATHLVFALLDAAAVRRTDPSEINELLTFAFRGLLADVGEFDAVRSAALGIELD